MPSAPGPCFVVRSSDKKSERGSDFFFGLKSAHADQLFVVISSEKISERFYIGAKVSAHEPTFTPTLVDKNSIFNGICGAVFGRLDYRTHAT